MQSAEKLGIEVERWEVRKPDDLERVFAVTSETEAVLVQWLALTVSSVGKSLSWRLRHLLPTVCEAESTWLPVD